MRINQLFEAQAEKTPDAIAVVFEEACLTYFELNQRANQVAHYLRTLGVGSEVLVGIYMERSLEMIVSVLGVLKAGGAYVPLDPSYPIERLTFILQDTQVPVILTQAKWLESLPDSQKTRILCLDSDWDVVAQQSVENIACETSANNLAYVIYTSGSTGQPKGVMIPHVGLLNQLQWRQTAFPLTEMDRVLQTISFSFDPSVWQIFWPLSYGARLVLAHPEGHKDSRYLVDVIARHQITVIALVPAMLRSLLDEKEMKQCNCLRYIFCGGESLPLDLQQKFFARLDRDGVLHNVYGPTEASIDATFWTCQRGSQHLVAPIGRPIINAEAYILDTNLQPVSVGEAGELHLGGVGLARGYLNRPELTAEKFIPNPFTEQPGARLYKTGDLARYLPDGNIEFLGRIDHQVKIRGFRIEPGEIEAVLSQYPAIGQTLVVAREDSPGNKQLVAYFTVSGSKTPNIQELRSFLKEKLPEYMVPTAFVMLQTFPLGPNGKVDRRLLPVPTQEHFGLGKTALSPHDAMELDLLQIWEDVLNVRPLGIKDNFFECGGNSLLATRLIAEVETVFRKRLSLNTLFEFPTVEQIAALLRSDQEMMPWRSLVAIRPEGTKPPLFCVHERLGRIHPYYNLARYLSDDQPVYGLQAPDIDCEKFPYMQVEEMVVDYVEAIQTVQPSGPYFLCGYSFGGTVAYEIAQQLRAQGHRVAMLTLFDTPNLSGEWFAPLLPKSVQQSKLVKSTKYAKKYFKKVYFESIKIWLILQKKFGFRFKLINKILDQLIFERYMVNLVALSCDVALKDYRPAPYADRVILFKASEVLEEEELQPIETDAQLGWGTLVKGGVEVYSIPCTHFKMFSNAQHFEELAMKLRERLEVAHLDERKAQSPLSSISV